MEAFPPSYAVSTSTNVWTLIAGYLDGATLAIALRVSRKWHESLAPSLWGNPGVHLVARDGLHTTDPRIGMLLFWRSLHITRYFVREMVHTIQLPSFILVSDYSASSHWLDTVVKLLPKLQSLDLGSLAIADHVACMELRRGLVPSSQSGRSLRLLNLSRCSNVTTQGFIAALEVFDQITYLDISGLAAARDHLALMKLATLPKLKILIFAAANIDDSLCSTLMQAIERRVRFLDISANPGITDRTLFRLSKSCLAKHGDDVTFLGTDIAKAAFKAFTLTHVDHLLLEVEPEVGITHLNISRTSITVQAMQHVLHSDLLESIDGGSLSSKESPDGRTWDLTLLNQSLLGKASSLVSIRAPLALMAIYEHGHDTPGFDLRSFPSLRHMVLADIPSTTLDNRHADLIIKFISKAATQARIASLNGRFGGRTIRKGPPTLQKYGVLQKISLEVYTPKVKDASKSESWNYGMTTQSVTEDEDSRALWSAAESDFSFFGNAMAQSPTSMRPRQNLAEHGEDVIQKVSLYRKQAQRLYYQALARGETHPKIEGYWPGTIQVIRR